MPRRSPFAIRLSDQERRWLEQRARRYTSPYWEVVRARVVLLAAAGWGMMRSPPGSTCLARWPASGASATSRKARPDWPIDRAADGRRLFPPAVVVEVKALACQLPAELGLPLARFSLSELRRAAIERGIVATVSGTTLWRWLSEDAIRPWRHRSWLFPRDPAFAAKAGDVLDLYAGRWRGRALRPDEFVLCADEKTSIQARARIHPTRPPGPGRVTRVEHEYERRGAVAYFAAWDVQRARVLGRCEQTTGIAPFERLVEQVMAEEPYRSARRVFWILDNGSSHRGAPCLARLHARWSMIQVVHLPVHASWLNQVEIYFSLVQRKVLTPAAWRSPNELEAQLLAFETRYAAVARPFEWRFTRRDLHHVLAGLAPVQLVA